MLMDPGKGPLKNGAYANHTTLMFAGKDLGDQTVATLPLEWFSRAKWADARMDS